MLVRVASTSLPTMGSSADFWRGRLTGLSIAYWKKSPSFDAVAADETLRPRSRFCLNSSRTLAL
jgi:hypothetical protein